MKYPWFQWRTPFILWPICWQGWVAILLMHAAFLPCAYLWMAYGDSNPVLAWIGAVLGMAAIAAFYAVALWTQERDYGGS